MKTLESVKDSASFTDNQKQLLAMLEEPGCGYIWETKRDLFDTLVEARTYGLVGLGHYEVIIDFRDFREVEDVQSSEDWLVLIKDAVRDAIDTDVGIDYWLDAHHSWMFRAAGVEKIKVPTHSIYDCAEYEAYKAVTVEVAK